MTRRFAVLGLPAPQGSKRHVGEGRMVESSKRVKPWRRHERRGGERGGELLLKGLAKYGHLDRFGRYAQAIASHERLAGRPAPSPTELGAKGKLRLSARFVEWMMCLPEGWVTDVPGLSRSEQLALLGNGVCPPQAAAALRHLLERAA